MNAAVTVIPPRTVTVQVPVPVQPAPVQPVNVEEPAGVATRVTMVPGGEVSAQLAPQLMSFMQQVIQFRQAGLNDQAEGVIELLRETLKRFDERIDIGKFFPPLPPLQPQMPQIPGAMPDQMPPEMAVQPPAGLPAELPVGA